MNRKQQKPGLVEILRHLAGPPRRSPGQRLWLTAEQLRRQGLRPGDFRWISPTTEASAPAATPPTVIVATNSSSLAAAVGAIVRNGAAKRRGK